MRDKSILTIQSVNHGQCYLSREVYEILNNDHPSPKYKKGARVRLITDSKNRDILGYHFDENYLTVCRVDAEMAEFCGIEKQYLKQVCETIDECCGQPEGSFAKFCKDHPDIDKYIAERQFKDLKDLKP